MRGTRNGAWPFYLASCDEPGSAISPPGSFGSRQNRPLRRNLRGQLRRLFGGQPPFGDPGVITGKFLVVRGARRADELLVFKWAAPIVRRVLGAVARTCLVRTGQESLRLATTLRSLALSSRRLSRLRPFPSWSRTKGGILPFCDAKGGRLPFWARNSALRMVICSLLISRIANCIRLATACTPDRQPKHARSANDRSERGERRREPL